MCANSSDNVTWTLYTRRWAFLAGLAVLQFFGGISFTSYGQISDFYVLFFRASHAQVDWITNARNISAILITFPLAWMVFKGVVRLRIIILIVASCSTFGLLLVTVSLSNRSFFSVIVLGQLLCGLSETVGIAVPGTFAAVWFPESQVGTAIAINVMGVGIGDGTGYILPAILIYGKSRLYNASTILHNSTNFLEEAQQSLQIMYGSFLAVSAAVSALFYWFVTDRPPSPPTAAQQAKDSVNSLHPPREFYQETRQLFLNRSYVFACVELGFVFQIVLLENLMMSEIIGESTLFGIKLNAGIVSGFVMSLYSVGGTIGFGIGGKVVNKYKRYKVLSIFGSSFMFLASLAILVSVYYEQIHALFFSNAMFGLVNGVTVVVIFEIVTQQTYPMDETMVNTWLTGIQMLIGLCLGIFGRLIFTAFGSMGVLGFQSLCLLFGISLLCFISPRNRRLEYGCGDEEESMTNGDARQPLMDDQEQSFDTTDSCLACLKQID